MGGNVTFMEERKGAYRVLMGEPDGKRPLLRLRRRLKNNIKMDFSRSGIGRYGLEGSGSG